MLFRVLDPEGRPLDAHLELEGNELVFHSRGGSRGHPGARNLDYGPALRLLLERLRNAGGRLGGAWLDSREVEHLLREERRILDETDFGADPNLQFRTMSDRMQAFGHEPGAPRGGSRVKRIRLRVEGLGTAESLERPLRLERMETGTPPDRRHSAAELDKVTAEHVWNAALRLQQEPGLSSGEEIGDFELVVYAGVRFSPLAVVRLAAADALGQARSAELAVDSEEESCRVLREAGFEVAPRGGACPAPQAPLSEDDRRWVEGRPARVAHLRRERASGLARAKRQSFVRQHGALRCERCGLDPLKSYGPDVGEACIEVHHARMTVGEMEEGHITVLDDLECLCANCHRIAHALLRLGENS